MSAQRYSAYTAYFAALDAARGTDEWDALCDRVVYLLDEPDDRPTADELARAARLIWDAEVPELVRDVIDALEAVEDEAYAWQAQAKARAVADVAFRAAYAAMYQPGARAQEGRAA